LREIPRLAVSGATVIDGTGRTPLQGMTVLIEGDKVAAVGSTASTPIPPDVAIIDGISLAGTQAGIVLTRSGHLAEVQGLGIDGIRKRKRRG